MNKGLNPQTMKIDTLPESDAYATHLVREVDRAFRAWVRRRQMAEDNECQQLLASSANQH